MSRRAIDPAYFEETVGRAFELYRTGILPWFLGRYYSGKGYHLVARLLETHDRWDLREIMSAPEPETKWLDMADEALDFCPLEIEEGVSRESRNTIVLARFFVKSCPSPGNPCGETSRRVVLYRGSFEVSWFDSGGGREILEDMILRTIFHEYVHFFESYFLASEQPLAAREGHRGGFKPKRLTPAQAEKLDKKYAAGNPWFWMAVGIFAAASAVFIASGIR